MTETSSDTSVKTASMETATCNDKPDGEEPKPPVLPPRKKNRKGKPQWDSDEEDLDDDETPDHIKQVLEAAENGNNETLLKILSQQPDLVNCHDIDDYTPLHRACYNGHLETIELLLERGADITARSITGWQPLHSAVKWSQEKAAAMLLAAGADVNSVSNGGVTPLHLAAAIDNRALLELLLFRPDIIPNPKSDSNETPYDIAYRSSPWYRLFDLAG